jgi:hypothetical protein
MTSSSCRCRGMNPDCYLCDGRGYISESKDRATYLPPYRARKPTPDRTGKPKSKHRRRRTSPAAMSPGTGTTFDATARPKVRASRIVPRFARPQMTYVCPQCGDRFVTGENLGVHLTAGHLHERCRRCGVLIRFEGHTCTESGRKDERNSILFRELRELVHAVRSRFGHIPAETPPWLAREISLAGGMAGWLHLPFNAARMEARNLPRAIRAVAVPLIASGGSRKQLPRWLFAEVSRVGAEAWLASSSPRSAERPARPASDHPRFVEQLAKPKKSKHRRRKKNKSAVNVASDRVVFSAVPRPLFLHYVRGQRLNSPTQCDQCGTVSRPTWHYDNSNRGAVTVCECCRALAQRRASNAPAKSIIRNNTRSPHGRLRRRW